MDVGGQEPFGHRGRHETLSLPGVEPALPAQAGTHRPREGCGLCGVQALVRGAVGGRLLSEAIENVHGFTVPPPAGAAAPRRQHGELMSNHWIDELRDASRITGIDLARALALLGMVAVHSGDLAAGDGSPLPLSLLAGKAAALFAVLAGFSVALSTRRYDRTRDAAAALTVRGAAIAFLGLVLGSLGTSIAVILVNYGAMFVLAPLALRLRTRILAASALLWMVVTPVLGFWLRDTFDLARDTAVPHLGNYTDVGQLLTSVFLTGYYPVLQWFGYLLVGLLLARLDWSAPSTALRVGMAGAGAAVVAYGTSMLLLASGGRAAIEASAEGVPAAAWGSVEAGMFTGSWGTVPTDTWWWMAVAGPHTSTVFDLLVTGGVACATIAACIQACRLSPGLVRALTPLLVAGTMPLTLYSLHIVLSMSSQNFFAQALALLIVAVAWKTLAGARPGPLEWGLAELTKRVVTYIQRPAEAPAA